MYATRVVKQLYVYILASKRNGTLYIGVTSNLVHRVWQHKSDQAEGFTKRYGVHMLVWYEACGTMDVAIAREKAIKEWQRAWKIRLIQEINPEWKDLYDELLSLGFEFQSIYVALPTIPIRHSGAGRNPGGEGWRFECR